VQEPSAPKRRIGSLIVVVESGFVKEVEGETVRRATWPMSAMTGDKKARRVSVRDVKASKGARYSVIALERPAIMIV